MTLLASINWHSTLDSHIQLITAEQKILSITGVSLSLAGVMGCSAEGPFAVLHQLATSIFHRAKGPSALQSKAQYQLQDDTDCVRRTLVTKHLARL